MIEKNNWKKTIAKKCLGFDDWAEMIERK